MLAELLAVAGAQVTTAQSAAEAMSRLDAEVPSVLVVDLGMPHVNGVQLIEQIRRHHEPRVRRIPAAALTAYTRAEDRVKALRAGFQIHLAKPTDPAELVTTVAALAKRFMPEGPNGSTEAAFQASRR
jgi:CheY-like chemotaxis protein